MGQEIVDSCFTPEDFTEFHRRLVEETGLLESWVADGGMQAEEPMGGCELEAWLVDDAGRPAPCNEAVLNELSHPLVVPELSTFNVELNTPPGVLRPGFFDRLYGDLDGLWQTCEAAASRHQAHMLMIGILPTVTQADLVLDNMSGMTRYRALNEQVFRLRGGRPLRLAIEGRESLHLSHHDVMLEAATTSFQLHIKVGAARAARLFNAAKIISGPMVAISANSPLLFGRDLWDETRIPLFEQAVAVGGSDYSKRVTFGIHYAERSILECFVANRDRYPVLMPQLMDSPPEELAHLRLHNGTIWRWNRPLVGFGEDGKPHFRIEHRVVPSGPTVQDMVANAALMFGLLTALQEEAELERRIPFEVARQNFYACARDGLAAEVGWLDGERGNCAALCRERLLPLARDGLERLGFASAEIDPLLTLLGERLDSGLTGAAWQRQWVATHGRDLEALVNTYRQRQKAGKPVHEWKV